MIPRKPIEWTFRRLPLLIVLIIVPPILVATVLERAPASYQSSASVIVADPSLVTGPGPTASNRFATAAEAQSQALQALLTTRTFVDQIAIAARLVPSETTNGTTVIAPTVSQAALKTVRDEVRSDLSVSVNGANVLGIAAQSTSPVVAQRLVSAAVAAYQANVAAQAERQRTISQQFYTDRLAIVQQQADAAVAELDAYRTAHPVPADARPGTIPADPNLQALQSHADVMTAQVQGVLQAMGQLDVDSASAQQQLAAAFAVADEPLVPTEPLRPSLMHRLGYPLAAAVGGMLLAAAYIYLKYQSDHTIRSSEDLVPLGVPLLGYVPHVNVRQHQRLHRRLRWPRKGFARGLAASIHGDLNTESVL